jgi:hypothetical protein
MSILKRETKKDRIKILDEEAVALSKKLMYANTAIIMTFSRYAPTSLAFHEILHDSIMKEFGPQWNPNGDKSYKRLDDLDDINSSNFLGVVHNTVDYIRENEGLYDIITKATVETAIKKAFPILLRAIKRSHYDFIGDNELLDQEVMVAYVYAERAFILWD